MSDHGGQGPAPARPLPLEAWSLASRAGIGGVLTDIDDTLTEAGAIHPLALQALHQLQRAGVPVLAITGRPLGWSEPFALSWPVVAIVAENGAVAVSRDGAGLKRDFVQDEATRQANALRLAAAAQKALKLVPGATLATDSAGRVTDIAIDHNEHAHLNAAQVADVVACLQGEGLTVTVSSIHINAWLGDHNKRSGAQWALRQHLGIDLARERASWVYVGDSTNDEAMFEWMTHSVGVANLMNFKHQLQVWPRYLTSQARGAGFAEVAQAILMARQGR